MITTLLLNKARKNWIARNTVSDNQREQDILGMLKTVKHSCVTLRAKLYADLDTIRERMASKCI